MQRPALLLALAVLPAVLLAGCSGGDGGDGGGSAVTSSSGASTAPPPPPVPTTDTLHFLAAPLMTTLGPSGSDERTPVGFGNGGPDGNQAPPAQWAHQVTAPTLVNGGEVRVWVEVKEQMLPSPFNPAEPPCTWRLTTNIGGDTEPLVNCANEPVGPIQPGIKELSFTLVLQSDIELEVGETLTVTLERTAFSASTNNAVDALSGSAEHDSRLQLRGLKEPVGE